MDKVINAIAEFPYKENVLPIIQFLVDHPFVTPAALFIFVFVLLVLFN